MNLWPHTVRIVRPGTREADYGNGTEPDWEDVTETVVPRCSVQPENADEVTVDRDNISTRWVAYLPAGTDIRAGDRVIFNSDTYDVDGDPQRWDFAPLAHVVANLRRSTG